MPAEPRRPGVATPQSLSLSTPAVSVATAPAHGARITSLVDACGNEWIAQPRVPPVHRRPGDDFVRPEIGGWDEMCHTIDACTSSDGLTHLPDHGDGWSSSWSVRHASDEAITVAFTSDRVPIEIERTLRATPHGVTLEYVARNRSDVPLPLFWTAHPLIAADFLERIDVLSDGQPILRPVTPNAPSEVELTPGRLPHGTSVKYWADPAGAAVEGVEFARRSSTLTIRWDSDELPYFGVFVDHDQYGPGVVLSPQPSTAYYDSAERASRLRRLPELAADSERAWSIDLSVTAATKPAPRSEQHMTAHEHGGVA